MTLFLFIHPLILRKLAAVDCDYVGRCIVDRKVKFHDDDDDDDDDDEFIDPI